MALSLVFLPQFQKEDGQPVDLMEQNTSLNKPQKSEHRHTESESLGKLKPFETETPTNCDLQCCPSFHKSVLF